MLLVLRSLASITKANYGSGWPPSVKRTRHASLSANRHFEISIYFAVEVKLHLSKSRLRFRYWPYQSDNSCCQGISRMSLKQILTSGAVLFFCLSKKAPTATIPIPDPGSHQNFIWILNIEVNFDVWLFLIFSIEETLTCWGKEQEDSTTETVPVGIKTMFHYEW